MLGRQLLKDALWTGTDMSRSRRWPIVIEHARPPAWLYAIAKHGESTKNPYALFGCS